MNRISATKVILVFLLIGLTGCGPEGPTNSPVVSAGAPEYLFLYSQVHPDRAYRYSLSDNEFDTLLFPDAFDVSAIAVCDASREVYFVCNDEFEIRVYSMDSFSMSAEIPIRATYGIAVSPDGRHLAIHEMGVLHIVRRSDLSEVFVDSNFIQEIGEWSRDGRSYYFAGAHDGKFGYAVVHLNPIPHRIQLSEGDHGLLAVRVSGDERYLFSLRTDVPHGFEVFDIAAGAPIFGIELPSAFGDIAVSPDRSTVWFTAPKNSASAFHGPQSDSPLIYEYDVQTNSLARVLNAQNLPGGGLGEPIDLDQLWISPDGDRLVACSKIDGSAFIDYSVIADSIVHADILSELTYIQLSQ